MIIICNEQQRQQEEQMLNDQEAMEFSIKCVTSFDEGGFIQGAAFNLSDTMASEMNDLM